MQVSQKPGDNYGGHGVFNKYGPKELWVFFTHFSCVLVNACYNKTQRKSSAGKDTHAQQEGKRPRQEPFPRARGLTGIPRWTAGGRQQVNR